eukprot:2997881-Prymnesium_polylepis.2
MRMRCDGAWVRRATMHGISPVLVWQRTAASRYGFQARPPSRPPHTAAAAAAAIARRIATTPRAAAHHAGVAQQILHVSRRVPPAQRGPPWPRFGQLGSVGRLLGESTPVVHRRRLLRLRHAVCGHGPPTAAQTSGEEHPGEGEVYTGRGVVCTRSLPSACAGRARSFWFVVWTLARLRARAAGELTAVRGYVDEWPRAIGRAPRGHDLRERIGREAPAMAMRDRAAQRRAD